MAHSARRLVKSVLIALAIVVVLLLGAELYSRFVSPTDPEGEASITLRNQVEGFEPTATISLTGTGLRPASWSRRSGNPEILCLGTDNTFHMLQGDDKQWWGQLEDKLREEKPQARTVGMGMAGATLVDLAAWIEAYEGLEEFDAVVVYAGISEIRARTISSDLSADAPGRSIYGARVGLKKLLMDRSGLLRNMINSRGRFQQRVNQSYGGLSKQNAISEGHQLERNVMAELRDRYRSSNQGAYAPFLLVDGYLDDPVGLLNALSAQALAGAERIAARCHQAGVPLLLVFESTLESLNMSPEEVASMRHFQHLGEDRVAVINPAWVWRAQDRIASDLLEASTEKEDFEFIDLREAIPKDLNYHYDERLLTDAGAELTAELLLEPVVQLLDGQAVVQPSAVLGSASKSSAESSSLELGTPSSNEN